MFSRTALGADEVTSCLRQDTAEGSKRAMSTSSCQSVPVPQHARLAITVVKQRGRRSFFFLEGGKYFHFFFLILYLDSRFTSKEKVERLGYSQLNIQKLTNYQIQFWISKKESQTIISTYQLGRC